MSYKAIIEAVLEVERQEAERTRDEVSSAPREPATDEQIAQAEKWRGMSFPESYKEFLRTCNGWDAFAWGRYLFGTKEMAEDEYEEFEETRSYDEDISEELNSALIIGADENDATLVLLVSSGEVVTHKYEELERYLDLPTYLKQRKTALLEMRAWAEEAIARTKAEWDPAFRADDDAALTEQLRELLAEPRRPIETPDPSEFVLADIGPTPAASELVLREQDEDEEEDIDEDEDVDEVDEDGDEDEDDEDQDDEDSIGAMVDLGLVLYLNAAPSEEEVLAAFRLWRKHFPFAGPMEWRSATAYSFFSESTDDPDSEPFAGELHVDDQGFFGLRAQGGPKKRHILNVRAIPPEDSYDEDVPPARRASFVEVLLPPDADPQQLRALCHALVDLLPVRSGQGGWFARVNTDFEPDPWNEVYQWCRRYFALEPCYIDGWLAGALTRHRGAGWLTVLGKPFVDALGPFELSDAITRHESSGRIVLTAGELTLGDVQTGDFPMAIAEVARLLEPVSMTSWSRHGHMSMGGIMFSTFSSQLPGSFCDHHATESFMRRFVDPRAFLGPSAWDEAVRLIAKLRDAMSSKERDALGEQPLEPDDGFSAALRALYNASCHVNDKALVIEALEHAARFPDWNLPQVYNNLLIRYFDTDQIDAAMKLMPIALRSAEDNSFTYHSAACVLVKAGKLDEAFDCVRRAKDADYPHMDKILVDDDLLPLRSRRDWQALFEGDSSA